MRMLFLCFVVVLFISDNAAHPVDSADIVEASGEKEIVTSDDNSKSAEKSVDIPVEKSVSEQLNSENEMPEEVIRSKKSNYPSDPYSNAPYPSAPYPSAPYSSAPYPSAPYPSASYPSSTCGCSNQYAQQSVNYGTPQLSYGPPSYNSGYSGFLPGYGQTQYSRPKYGGRKGKSYLKHQSSYPPQASYHSVQPYYQPPQSSYQAQSTYQSPQPSYQSPQPSYQSQVSYQSPDASYQSPSYQPSQPAYQSAPDYVGSSSSYRSSSYANQAYEAPGHSQTYSYPSPAPNVQCGSNVLVGCQPHVSQVPCSGFSPSYGSSNYAQPQQYYAPGYRNADEGSVSTSNTNEKTSDTADIHNTKPSGANENTSVSSILSAPIINPSIDKGTNNEHKNGASHQRDATLSTTNSLSPEEQTQKKIETLMKMSDMAKKIAEEEASQPNHLTITNPHKINDKSSLSGPPSSISGPPSSLSGPPSSISGPPSSLSGPPSSLSGPPSSLSGPPPTSANLAMNSALNKGNQLNTQFMQQQRPNPWL